MCVVPRAMNKRRITSTCTESIKAKVLACLTAGGERRWWWSEGEESEGGKRGCDPILK